MFWKLKIWTRYFVIFSAWFIVCQVMVSACVLFHVIATFILILMVLNMIPQYLKEVILMGTGFVYFFVGKYNVKAFFLLLVILGKFDPFKRLVKETENLKIVSGNIQCICNQLKHNMIQMAVRLKNLKSYCKNKWR